MEKLLNLCILLINSLLIIGVIVIAIFTFPHATARGNFSLSSFIINFSFIGLLPLGTLAVLRIFLKIIKAGFVVKTPAGASLEPLEILSENKVREAITTNLLLIILLSGVAILSMFGTDSVTQDTVITTMYSFGYVTTIIGGILLVISIVVAKVLLLKHRITLANRFLLAPRYIIATGVLIMFLTLVLL